MHTVEILRTRLRAQLIERASVTAQQERYAAFVDRVRRSTGSVWSPQRCLDTIGG